MTMIPAIFGISGYKLTDAERDLFRARAPLGFILFRRNIDTPDQTRALIASLRELTGRADMPILVDQEGARVQKLRPPHWIDLPDMRQIGDLYARDPQKGLQAVTLHTQIVAGQLRELGINTVCAPVLDVPVAGAHDVIGDRAFAENADIVVELGAAMTAEYLRLGIMPIVKHIPGHGRTDEDSHYASPVVKADRATLDKTDFKAFREVAKRVGPEKLWAMTAHVVFTELDDAIVSVSKKSIDFVRAELGYVGPILSDTIEMDALGGSLPSRAAAAIAAGCDAFLQCNGIFEHMKSVAETAPDMTDAAKARFAAAEKIRAASTAPAPDWRATYEQLKQVLGKTEFRAYRSQEPVWAAA